MSFPEPDEKPKTELHVHLEGTVQPTTLLEIAHRNDEPLPATTVEELAALYEFSDFAAFIKIWNLTTNCLRTGDDFRRVVVDYARQAAAQGAVYIEGIFSAAERVERGLDWDEVFTGYTEGAVEAYQRFGVIIRFTPDLYRGLSPEIAEECARVAVRYRDRGVVGIGVGGKESATPIAPYRKAFEIARDGGLGIVPHAGETAGPDSVWDVLSVAPDRIRHGIAAARDPMLLRELRDRGVVCDVCPTSNLRTGAVASLAAHPLPQMRAAGVACTISTDDPAMFGTDLDKEFRLAAKLGLSAEAAFDASLAGALCDSETLAKLVTLRSTLGKEPQGS